MRGTQHEIMKISAALISVALILSACGDALVKRASQTVTVSLQATNAARDEFVKWDKQHQLDIVDRSATRKQAEEALGEYRAKRQRVVQSFAVAYGALAGAATAIPLVAAGKRPQGDLSLLLLEALSAVNMATEIFRDIRATFDDSPIPPPSLLDAGPSPEFDAGVLP